MFYFTKILTFLRIRQNIARTLPLTLVKDNKLVPWATARTNCRRPRIRQHQDVAWSGINAGATAEVTCHATYTLPEGGRARTVVCRHGQWSASPTCSVRSCPAEPAVTNAIADTNATAIGTIITYVCLGDFRFPSGVNTAQIQCTAKREWFPDIGNCQGRCPPLPYFDHATLQGKANGDVNSTAQFQCRPGYRFEDGSTHSSIRCQEDLQWELVDDCKVDSCPTFALRHASVSTNITVDGMVAEVKCDVGFRFLDGTISQNVECALQKSSISHEFNCYGVACSDPPVVRNAARKVTGTVYGSVVTYTCNDRLRFIDGETTQNVMCLWSGLWSETDTLCEAGRCPPLPLLSGTQPLHSPSAANTIAIYRCLPGHMFSDGTFRQVARCNGIRWNNTDDVCNAIGRASVSSNDTTFGSEVNITCEKGFTFPTGRTVSVVCNGTGGWTNMPDACQDVICTLQPSVIFARSRAVSTAKYGDSLTYTCMSGYWLRRGVFSQTTTCSAYGEWQPKPRHCVATRCPALSTWAGLFVNTSHLEEATVVNVTCVDGKVFADGSTLAVSQCTEDGVWDPKVPDCIDPEPGRKFHPPPKEAKHSRTIGAVAVFTVAVTFCVLVVVDAPALKDAILMFVNGPPPRAHKLTAGAQSSVSRQCRLSSHSGSQGNQLNTDLRRKYIK
ncbi:hypothetical protein NP493_1573g00038 [Ridgeia piscesae]|uniref:Sushi domain-containing protein n=1 Tax=Ridgeia piscesae TaxID=27915 RepID=A0AAD9NBX3_RIDPI|nr:hypothetical protein NP493_1573g00038 [Ridgeia piscesae]